MVSTPWFECIPIPLFLGKENVNTCSDTAKLVQTMCNIAVIRSGVKRVSECKSQISFTCSALDS